MVAQWRLYEKAGQPGDGRRGAHLELHRVPEDRRPPRKPPLAVPHPRFRPIVHDPQGVDRDSAQSFGKRSLLDYVLVILLNGLYIFNLGMSYDTEYLGPVYGKHIPENDNHAHPSLA
jgi:hypothetical protein